MCWMPKEIYFRASSRSRACAVISISRRTDAPRFFLPRIVAALRQGAIAVRNPRSGAESRVLLGPGPAGAPIARVLVWWSKDFTAFRAAWGDPATRAVLERYAHAFQYTINEERGSVLEPGLHTPLAERLAAAQWQLALSQFAKSAPTDVEQTEVGKVQKKLETARVKLARQENATGQAKPE